MTYTTALIASAQPDAPPSAVSDLFTMAKAEGFTPADAIADRRALQAVYNAPQGSEIDAADKARSDATSKLDAAKQALRDAQDTLDKCESEYVIATAAASKVHIRSREALAGLDRPAVAAATQTPKD